MARRYELDSTQESDAHVRNWRRKGVYGRVADLQSTSLVYIRVMMAKTKGGQGYKVTSSISVTEQLAFREPDLELR
jgi:hypothetical protein